MNAHEHIWLLIADCARMGLSKDEALTAVRKHASYAILPDRIRSVISPKSDGSLDGNRSISHFTDNAWMSFPHGEALKNFKGLEQTDYYIPDGAVNSALGPASDMGSFVRHNKEFLKSPHSAYTFAHLGQDELTDFIDGILTVDKSGKSAKELTVYGHKAQSVACRFDKTGKEASLEDYRSLVDFMATLTSVKLWDIIRGEYPDMRIDEVTKATLEACKRDYGGKMAETSVERFVAPSAGQRALIEAQGRTLKEPVEIAEQPIKNLDDVRSAIVGIGAFKNEADVASFVEQTMAKVLAVYPKVRERYNKKRSLNMSKEGGEAVSKKEADEITQS